MRRLNERGIPIVTLVSDVPGKDRIGYVGVDNRAAGRLAGHLIGRFIPDGKVKEWLFRERGDSRAGTGRELQ